MPPSLKVERIEDLGAYQAYRAANAGVFTQRAAYERGISASGMPASVPGYCFLCQREVRFTFDYEYAIEIDGLKMPNFREKMNCSACGFNNRMRAAVQILDEVAQPRFAGELYLTEQVTPMYALFRKRYPKVLGSEYLGNSIQFGVTDTRGVRNESVTKLTFEDGRFAAIVSFDVLEHVPDYGIGFREFYRCLEPGGVLLLSVPFTGLPATITRARVSTTGEVEHLLPPEYHGDPLKDAGCLCFYHFGWDMLDRLRMSGFSRAEALFYYSTELGYIGRGEQMIFAASKPA